MPTKLITHDEIRRLDGNSKKRETFVLTCIYIFHGTGTVLLSFRVFFCRPLEASLRHTVTTRLGTDEVGLKGTVSRDFSSAFSHQTSSCLLRHARYSVGDIRFSNRLPGVFTTGESKFSGLSPPKSGQKISAHKHWLVPITPGSYNHPVMITYIVES
jgi:hypothetical protein